MTEDFLLVYSLTKRQQIREFFLWLGEDWSISPSLCRLLVHLCHTERTVQANTSLAENPEAMESGDSCLTEQTTYFA